MSARSTMFLGLSIGERSIACAEVASGGPGETTAARRTGEFELPEELSAGTAESSGRALGGFLRSHGFTAGRAVVGVPARWLIAHERELPPSDEQAAGAILRLAAERLRSGDGQEMVFDYAGRSDPSQPSRALIIGMLRQRVADVRRLLDAAGLTLSSLGASSLAVASENGAMLMISRQGVELVCRDDGSPRAIRPLSAGSMNGHGPASVAPLAAELRRSLVLAPTAGTESISLLDGVGLSPTQVDELSQRIGRPLARVGRGTGAEPYAVAIALARAGSRPQTLGIDFINSRLAEQVKSRWDRQTVWGIAIAASLILGIAALWYDVRQREAGAADLDRQLAAIAGDLKAAEGNIDRIDYGRGYFDRRPPMMECLREVTMAFRGDSNIWATSFSARDNRKAQLIGKATDQRSVLSLLDRLKRNTRLTEVKLADLRDGTGRTREVTFSLSFEFARLN